MPTTTTLQISRHRHASPTAGLAELSGNDQQLLGWLETHLGLAPGPATAASRIREFAARLTEGQGANYQAALAADRWGTVRHLLAIRDALRMQGWTGAPVAAVPIVADLALVERSRLPLAFGTAERLEAVTARLGAGLRLPAHDLVLDEPIHDWPPAWRPVLRALTCRTAAAPVAAASSDTVLGQLQRAFLSREEVQVTPDASLAWWRAGSPSLAVATIVSSLAAEPEALADTVLCCADDGLAAAVDNGLAQLGLPTAGSAIETLAHPVLQLLPLVLALSWEPVDPALLLEFLLLPVSPIPTYAARKLAEALADQPGLHSTAWDAAVQRLTVPAGDATPERIAAADRTDKRITAWLHFNRVPRGESLPADLLADRAMQLARWAQGYAGHADTASSLRPLLFALGSAATELARLVRDDGHPVSAPELPRLLSIISIRPDLPVHPARVGGPLRIRGLHELDRPCARLVWLGRQAAGLRAEPWSPQDIEALRAAGVDVDDGVARVRALRLAEVAALACVTDRLTLVDITSQNEQSGHPLWTRILHAAGGDARKKHWQIEVSAVLAGRATLEPWHPAIGPVQVALPPAPATTWRVPAGLLVARETESATSLGDRLKCPLSWTLNYQAKIRPAALASLPDTGLLTGRFAHAVLDTVFREQEGLPTPELAARRAQQVFDERVAKDAATLLRPADRAHLTDVRDKVGRTASLLVRTLRAGGYDRVETEIAEETTLLGKKVTVRVDCLARDATGRMAVIDIKGGKLTYYRSHLENGHATQLYFYAAGLAEKHGIALDEIPVAYLSLGSVAFATPGSRPLPGTLPTAHLAKAPPVAEAWDHLLAVIAQADAWMIDGTVPVRPLQAEAEWPEGLARVVEAPSRTKKKLPSACGFCKYPVLCGAKEVR
jgi:CRISPR/Cas system-associated exonuclease Cas4 (RecB family)